MSHVGRMAISRINACVEHDKDGDDVDVFGHLALETDEPLQQATPTENEINICIRSPECTANKVAKEREVLLLECATHIKMAWVQRYAFIKQR